MRVLVALSLLAVMFAGCSEETEPLVVQEVEDPPIITDPSDYSYNTTKQHLHDYWNDMTEVEVFSKTVPAGYIQITPFADVVVRGDTDQVVPQGAKWVNVTVAWDLAAPELHGGVELWLMTARSSEPFRVASLSNGETIGFESDNGHNDLPHQRLSAWRFLVRFLEAPSGTVVVQGDVTVHVSAARGLEIPLYPGHPDSWRGAMELPLLAHEGDLGFNAGPLEVAGLGLGTWCLSECFESHRPDDRAIVPHNASVVEVVLRETSGTGPAMMPGLAYHGADTLAWQRVEPDQQNGAERIYWIPVDAGSGDGAYAQQSLWEFDVLIDEPQPDGVFVGAYEIEVRVLKEAP